MVRDALDLWRPVKLTCQVVLVERAHVGILIYAAEDHVRWKVLFVELGAVAEAETY